MNRQASPVLPVLFSLLLSACLVPSLSELESERPRSCDADHPCLSGYGCVAGRCVAGEGRVCTPGDKVACGSSVGTCEEGTRTCGQDGQFGQCEGATNPTSEICDSQDNDCDGNVDSDVAQWVEQDGQPDMPVAVPFGTGDRRALVVAWEQGDSVRARRVRADGTLDEVLAPASTVTLSGYRASGPAILRCDCDSCGCHALAWFDARACDGGTCNRLLIGKLEDEGWTNVNNSGSRDAGKVTTVDTRLGKGLSMELVAAGGRVFGAYAHLPENGTGAAQAPEVLLFNCPGDLFSSSCSRVALGEGSEPTLAAVRDGGTEAVAAWRATDGGIRLAALDLAGLGWATLPAAAPDWGGTPLAVAGTGGEQFPRLAPNGADGWDLYSAAPASGSSLSDGLVLRTGPCSGSQCALAVAPAQPYGLKVQGPVVALSFERRDGHVAFAAQLQADGGSRLMVVTRDPSAPGWTKSASQVLGTPGSSAPFVMQAGAFTTLVYRGADGGITAELVCGP